MPAKYKKQAHRLASMPEASRGDGPVQGGSSCIRAGHALRTGTPFDPIPLLCTSQTLKKIQTNNCYKCAHCVNSKYKVNTSTGL